MRTKELVREKKREMKKKGFKDLRELNDNDIVDGSQFELIWCAEENRNVEKWEYWRTEFKNIKKDKEKIVAIEKINGRNINVEDYFFYKFI
jgi:hypothetical protein